MTAFALAVAVVVVTVTVASAAAGMVSVLVTTVTANVATQAAPLSYSPGSNTAPAPSGPIYPARRNTTCLPC